MLGLHVPAWLFFPSYQAEVIFKPEWGHETLSLQWMLDLESAPRSPAFAQMVLLLRSPPAAVYLRGLQMQGCGCRVLGQARIPCLPACIPACTPCVPLAQTPPHPAADQGSMRQVDLELEHRPVAGEPAGPPSGGGGGAAADAGASNDDFDGEGSEAESEEDSNEEEDAGAAGSGSDHEFGWVWCYMGGLQL